MTIKIQDSKRIQSKEGIYKDPTEYISDELKKIDLMLELAVLSQRIKKDVEKDALAGFYISEKEVDVLLDKEEIDEEKDKDNLNNSSDVIKLIQAIEKQRELIAHRSELTRGKGIILPIEHLKRLFGLTPFEVDSLLLCLAPELDTKYEKLYAYLQDDVSKKYPTLNLILMLLTQTIKEQSFARQYFSAHAPLIRWQLLKFGEERRDFPVSPLSRPLCIDERITDFLLGNPFLDSATSEILNVLQPEGDIDSLHIKEDLKQRLKNLTRHLQGGKEFGNNIVIFFYGPRGVGKKKAAAAISEALCIPLLNINIRELLKNNDTFFDMVKRINREALLLQCPLLIEDFDLLFSEDGKINHHRKHLLKEISKFSYLTFLTGEQNLELKGELDNARYIKIHFPLPDFPLRKKIWEKALNGRNNFMTNLTLDVLAGKFKFTEGQIINAIVTAKDRTFLHPLEKDVITDEDLLFGCRQQNNQKLSELALKITPKFSWQDIVLPDDQLSQLREICNHLKYRHIVYGEWGFEKKISLGKGLNVLFSGPSGTGKTMAAEILANELRLEIYKIDLSQVVSKYIGETEKNLSRIFKEAETSNAILFFDEADALFGKRSEVKDAHDRYANIEIGYLLQKMEEYEGMTILATNLRQNIDEAFMRRMQFIVEFPFPDDRRRELIWRKIFPENAPLSSDMDFLFLSEKLRLTGGHIKNIALAAAFHATEETADIQMRHIMRAAKREYQKTGKSFLKTDFEPYYDLIGER